jgi:glycosyltransferase involved in cell wall biosynthesis
MKNIAILSSCLTRGGAERAAGELSVRLSEHANVYLFLLENKDVTYKYRGNIITLQFEKYYEKLRKKKFGSIISKFAYIKTISDIKQLKKKYSIDACVSFLEILNIMNLLSQKHEKIFLSVRNNRSMQNDTKLHKFENWVIKHFYKKADKVVALSYGVEEDLAKNFNIPSDKITTIYNYFDIEGMISRSHEPLPSDLVDIYYNNRVLLSMGRYVEQKNFEHLIIALKPVLKEHENVVLLILGQGDLKKKLESVIIDNELINKVFLVDYKSNPMPLIRNAEIFIMNSIYEGLCNSIVEAMVCGTLTVSSDCRFGPREMIANIRSYSTPLLNYKVTDRGILFPVDNQLELKNAIEYALDNPEKLRKCKYNSLQYFNESFNEKVEKKWCKLFEVDD